MASDLVTVAPVPGITVLTVSLLFASSLGILTTGVAPNAPATVTDAFAFELLAAALELELDAWLRRAAAGDDQAGQQGNNGNGKKASHENLNGGGRQAQSAYWLFLALSSHTRYELLDPFVH